MQAAGVLKQVAFQFCGTDLIPPSIKLAGPKLEKDQALLITSQVFAFRGKRDTLRVRARGNVTGSATEITGTLPIKSEFAKNTYIFPVRGVAYVGAARRFTRHRWAIPEEFALTLRSWAMTDFPIGEMARVSRIIMVTEPRCWRLPTVGSSPWRMISPKILRRCNGRMKVRKHISRDAERQAARLEKGRILGNYVMIDHGKSEFSLYAHLKPGSVRVKAGDQVKAGDVIGKLGSSGNSTEPHLHFHVTDNPDPAGAGIPMNFSNVTILWADLPRPIQSGDIVIAK